MTWGRWVTGIAVLCALAPLAKGSPWQDLRVQIDIEPLRKREPPEAVVLRPIARPLPPLGDELLEQKEIRLAFCVEPSGHVSEVSPLLEQNAPQGAAALGRIADTVKQWAFAPIPARGCFQMRWTFTAGANPGDTRAPPPKPKNIAHDLDPSQVVYKIDPHLPDNVMAELQGKGDAVFFAKICVDREGRISRINVLQSIPGGRRRDFEGAPPVAVQAAAHRGLFPRPVGLHEQVNLDGREFGHGVHVRWIAPSSARWAFGVTGRGRRRARGRCWARPGC